MPPVLHLAMVFNSSAAIADCVKCQYRMLISSFKRHLRFSGCTLVEVRVHVWS